MNNPEGHHGPEHNEAAVDNNIDETEVIITLPDEDSEKYKAVDIENREKFHERLKEYREDEVKTIDFAYDLGKEAHRPQRRDSGERYFEHVRSVAIILIDEAKVRDPDMIVSALLHDSVEDSALFGNSNQPYSQWKETSSYRLSKVFNPRVAEMVIILTKPKVDGQELKDKEQAHHFYIDNLKASSPETILIKMSDRLHNLRSLIGNTPEKQRKTIKETREVYWPIFEQVLEKYPEQGQHLLDEMDKQMTALEHKPE